MPPATNAFQRLPHPPTDREVTPEELYANPQWDPCELVDGKVIQMSPSGHRHGKIQMRLGSLIEIHARTNKLGDVFGQDTGFVFPNHHTVRGPDLMFLSRSRIPADLPEEGFLPVVPDFAVEIISPDDSFKKVTEKAESYIAIGVKLVWVIEPDAQRIYVFKPGQPVDRFSANDKITGEDVLPGLELEIKTLFEE